MKESLREKLAARALSFIAIAGGLYVVHECATLMLHMDRQQKLSEMLYGRCVDGDLTYCRDCAVNCHKRSQRVDSALRAGREFRP